MANLFNRAGMSTATSGTGTITLGSALAAVAVNLAAFQSFASAGVTDGATVEYLILDASGAWELGTGTYAAAGTTLARTVKFSSNANSAISLSGNAQVFIVALATDGGDLLGGTSNPFRGTDSPVNLQLNAANNGTKLTIALKGNNGNDPGPTNPVLIPFRSTTLASGMPKWAAVTAALSIDTNAAGATFGTVNGVPFRLWIVAFYNSGSPVLAFFQSIAGGAAPTAIASLVPDVLQASTAVSGSATSAGTFYTPNGTTVTNDAFCILGYVEYASGLATAGTYNSNPSKIQLFGPGVSKPGAVLQMRLKADPSQFSTTSNTFQNTNLSLSITPSAAPNLVRVGLYAEIITTVSSSNAAVIVSRGGAAVGSITYVNVIAASGFSLGLSQMAGVTYDAPGTTSATTYTEQLASGTSGNTVFTGSNDELVLEEIMA